MKKYGFNSGVIGSDQRRTEGGMISHQKFAVERIRGQLNPANSVKWSTDLLSIVWDATDPNSFPNNGGTTLTDLSGNGNDYVVYNSPSFVTDEGKPFFRTDGNDDYFKQSTNFPSGQPLGAAAGTVFFVMKTVDVQGLFLGVSAYLGAYRSGNKFYNSGYGSPTFHMDTEQKDNIYDHIRDGEWHYVEFKSVVNSSNGSDNDWTLFNYGSYEIACDIRAFGIYRKNLTTEESTQNYDYFNNAGYLSDG